MRPLFWGLAATSLLLLVLGFTVLSAPSTPEVRTIVMVEWYATAVIWTLLIGALVGAAGGLLARRRVVRIPNEPEAGFLSRVGSWGVWSQVAALVAGAGVAIALAAAATLGPLSGGEQVALVFGSGRILGPLGGAVAAASLFYLIVISAVRWGGQLALLRPARRA